MFSQTLILVDDVPCDDNERILYLIALNEQHGKGWTDTSLRIAVTIHHAERAVRHYRYINRYKNNSRVAYLLSTLRERTWEDQFTLTEELVKNESA